MNLETLFYDTDVSIKPTDAETEISCICCDSREVIPGALFAACEGERADGMDFIPEAVRRGAAAILCEREPPNVPVPVLRCKNVRETLARVAANFYGHPARQLCLIGVTGTNGKTTVTSLIAHLLRECLDAKVGLIGTIENRVGQEHIPARHTTPDAIELQRLLAHMVEQGCTHAVMEVSSHGLALCRTDGVVFDVGVFTNLSEDHLDFHETMRAYEEAKGKLFRQSRQAVVNIDDEAGVRYLLSMDCPCLTVSCKNDGADLTARGIRLSTQGVEFEAVTDFGISHAFLGIPGGFSVYNALCAIGCGLALGLPLHRLTEGLKTAPAVPGRVERVEVPANYTVVIDYAHTPDALENILMTLRAFTRHRLILVFGCGGERDRKKRPVMGSIAGELANVAIVTSDNPRGESPDAIICDILKGMDQCTAEVCVQPDREKAIRLALTMAGAGDVILLAGKGHESYQQLGDRLRRFDEREIIADFFR